MDATALVFLAVALAVAAAGMAAQQWWRRQQLARANELLDIVEGGLPPVSVEQGVRKVPRRRPGDRDEPRGDETWFRAQLAEPATVRSVDPASCDAPHCIDDPTEPEVLAVWGSDALAARVRAQQGLVRHILRGEGSWSISEGTVEVVMGGELDPMQTSAVMSDVSDLVRALNG